MGRIARLSLCILAVTLALATPLFSSAVRAAEWCVDPLGGDCYTTIQAAINAATAGDTINIHAGTY